MMFIFVYRCMVNVNSRVHFVIDYFPALRCKKIASLPFLQNLFLLIRSFLAIFSPFYLLREKMLCLKRFSTVHFYNKWIFISISSRYEIEHNWPPLLFLKCNETEQNSVEITILLLASNIYVGFIIWCCVSIKNWKQMFARLKINYIYYVVFERSLYVHQITLHRLRLI